MLKPLRRSFTVWAAFLLMPAMLLAQQRPLHLNPVIAKLAAGKTGFGLNTGDLFLVAGAITANTGNDIVRRVKEGWNIIRSTVPALNEGRALPGETR